MLADNELDPSTDGPPNPTDDVVRLDVETVLQVLGPDGPVARSLDGYEQRPEQLDMVRAVAEAFNDDGIATIEAGTGTGKSLAYLVPSILWSLANHQRVVVSTHTISLQEQLVHKDLPFLVERAGLQCSVALLKGRGNYLCRRKAAQAEAEGPRLVDDELQAELRRLLTWAKHTKDGSLSDLPVPPRPEVWEHVASESDNCLRARCPFHASCFFYGARRDAAKADILVANHQLLMADLAVRGEMDRYDQTVVLPPARRAVIDEAHHLEDVATSYFGSRVSLAAIERTLTRLVGRNERRGILPTLALALQSLQRPEDRPAAEGAVTWIDERLIPRRRSLAEEASECFLTLAVGLEDLLERPLPTNVEKLRVVPALRETEYWRQLRRAVERLASALAGYAQDIHGVTERIEGLGETEDRQVLYLGTELAAMQSRLAGYAAALREFVIDDEDEEVPMCRWLEAHTTARGPSVVLHAAPVAVGELLRKSFFERFDSVVLTSATLAVDRRFDHLHSRLGLNELSEPGRLSSLLVRSPFDYDRQAVLAVPRNLPEPNDPTHEAAAHELIADIVRISGGGAFILFTSYAALQRAWRALERTVRSTGCEPLRQGDTSRHRLLEIFARSGRGVLFATDSFWEGVDVRGNALRCVVIAKLPFSVPTEPIQQARLEAIEARGGDPFAEHTLPQAVLKLKQGFGRLIRSREDRGAVVILDSRIVRKRYGEVFLRSLPPAARLVADTDRVLDRLRMFLSG